MSKISLKNLIVIIIVSFVLISANIGGLYIYALDEAKNSCAAREMLETGEWIVPTYNYELRTDKPPLHYYFMILAYSIFGINAFAARFFSVIMGVFTIMITWYLARKYYGHRTSLYVSLALLSSLHFILQFHMAVPDPYLICLLTLGFTAFYIFYAENKPAFLLLSYISFGLGTLTKGPVAIVLPGLAILLFLVFTRTFTWRYFLKLKPLWIAAVLLLVVAPWFVMVGLKTKGVWIQDFFLYHNIERYTGTMEGHGAFFLITPLMVLIGLLPFSVFFLQSYRYGWKSRKKDHLLLYSGIISLTFIVFFSLSKTKLPNYTVPAYPFIAMLIGRYLDVLKDIFRDFKRSLTVSLSAYLIIALALPVGLYLGLDQDPLLHGFKSLSWYFLIIPVGAATALICIYSDKYQAMLLSLSLPWIVAGLVFFYFIFPRVDQVNPVAKLLPAMDRDKPVAGYRIFNSSFSFYLRKPIPIFEEPQDLQKYIDQTGKGYILTREAFQDEIENLYNIEILGMAKDIFETPTTVIWEIKE